jgi:hypothetical protein
VDYAGDVHALANTWASESRFSALRFDRKADTWLTEKELGVGHWSPPPGRSWLLLGKGRNDHAFAVWGGLAGLASFRVDPTSGKWSPVAADAIPLRELPAQRRLSVGSTGAAVLAWSEPQGSRVFVSVYDPSTDSFTPPATMQGATPSAGLGHPHWVAIDDEGNVSIVWAESSPASLWTNRWECRR